MSTQENNLLEKLDPIQRLYYDFDKEVKKLENYAVQKEREAMEVMYQILSDPKSYGEPVDEVVLSNKIDSIRQYVECLNSHADIEPNSPFSSTYLGSVIDRLYFDISGLCNLIQGGNRFKGILNASATNPVCIELTVEARLKLVALEMLIRSMDLDISHNEIRGKLPIPEALEFEHANWRLDAPKVSLSAWGAVIGKPYRLKSINEQ